MNQLPPPINQSPKRTGWVVYSVIVSFFLFLSVLANLVILAMAFGSGGARRHHDGRGAFEEEFLQGDSTARDKIAVISLTGVISSAGDGRPGEMGMVESIKNQLEQAVDDRNVKAIVLKINSPGGEVVASDAIYQAIVAARSEKPIVADIDGVGASGAYYAAVGANYIIANELSITGSIGVIMQSFTISDLMGKVGVKSHTFKSGKFKDILNPSREPTDQELALVQSLVMEVYEKFVQIVATERKMEVDSLKSGLADGRIFSGKQAFEAGFVNEIGYFDDAVDKAKELAQIDEAKVIRYVPHFSLQNILRFFGKADRTKIQIQVLPGEIKLEGGKLYYLPAHMF